MIDENPEREVTVRGVRTEMLGAYQYPRGLYAIAEGSPVKVIERLGVLIWYADQQLGRGKKKNPMNVPDMIAKWHAAVVGLAIAHSKDQADRYEASIDEILTPILTAPIAQIRELARGLLDSLKADASVPYLVWRSYEVWLRNVLEKAQDEGVVELKTQLATDICQLVETDVKDQLPEAIVRALQWRSAEQLEQVKQVVTKEKAAGRTVRLRGRESCLFIEAGGAEGMPEVCVQL